MAICAVLVVLSVRFGVSGSAEGKSSALVKRGHYLVEVTGCGDCHTPWIFDKALNMPVPDLSRALSGHPSGAPDPVGTVGQGDIGLIGPTFTSFKMPFGIVYSANLTPDQETGLGSWREADFIKAIRNGKHFGGSGRTILPPMPWMDIGRMTDEDLKAVFAYLHSLKPIRNAVPDIKVSIEAIDAMTASFEKLKQQMSPATRQRN